GRRRGSLGRNQEPAQPDTRIARRRWPGGAHASPLCLSAGGRVPGDRQHGRCVELRVQVTPQDASMTHSGWHFLQIPGPTNVPDRVLRAMARPVIDHRGPEFAALAGDVLARLRTVFKTSDPVAIYPGSGSGASEAA